MHAHKVLWARPTHRHGGDQLLDASRLQKGRVEAQTVEVERIGRRGAARGAGNQRRPCDIFVVAVLHDTASLLAERAAAAPDLPLGPPPPCQAATPSSRSGSTSISAGSATAGGAVVSSSGRTTQPVISKFGT